MADLFYFLSIATGLVLDIIFILVLVSVGISWFDASPYNPYVQLVYKLTETMYRPFRKWTRSLSMQIDLAPMAVMLIIVFLQKSIPTYLMYKYYQLK